MMAKGYKRLHADPCIYTCSEGERVAIVTVWVDDILLFADLAETMDQMKNDIRTKWETMDMGELNKIVGIGITQFPEEISISQKQSIQNILQRQGLADASPVQMPLDLNVRIKLNLDGNEGDRSNVYAQLLDELQFIANVMRPNIAYAINQLASYTANPSMQH
jgi:hypothetical protein